MTLGKYIKLTKLAAVPERAALTPGWEGFKPGRDNGDVSLPIDYTAEGYLAEDIKIGQCIVLNRTKRNGVTMPGILTTSPLQGLEGNRAETKNSVYTIEELPQN